MMRCYKFDTWFALSTVTERVTSAQSVYVRCPICADHGIDDLHLLYGSLQPVPDEIVSTCGNEQTAGQNGSQFKTGERR